MFQIHLVLAQGQTTSTTSNDVITIVTPDGNTGHYSIFTQKDDEYIYDLTQASLLKQKLDPRGEWTADLADKLPSIESNFTKFTFDLRPSLRFSDGKELTADDVEFSINVFLSPGINQNQNRYNFLKNYLTNDSFTKISRTSFVITLSKPNINPFPLFTFPIVPLHYFQKRYNDCLNGISRNCVWDDTHGKDSLGAGPFYIEDIGSLSYVPITLHANPEYYDADKILVDQLEFRGIRSGITNDDLVKADMDIVSTIYGLPDSLRNGSIPNMNLFRVDIGVTNFVFLNNLNPYWGTGAAIPGNEHATVENKISDAKLVRKAISLTIDRKFFAEYSKSYHYAGGIPANSIIPTYLPEMNSVYDPYNITEARELMIQAGFNYSTLGPENPDGTFNKVFFNITTLTFGTGPGTFDETVVEPYHSLILPQIGIGKTFKRESALDVIERIARPHNITASFEEGGYDIYYGGLYSYSGSLYSDILPNFGDMYQAAGRCDTGTCNNFQNFDLYENESGIAQAVRSYQNELDYNAKIADLSKVQSLLQEWRPDLPIIHVAEEYGVNKDLTGLDLTALYQGKERWEGVMKPGFTLNNKISDKHGIPISLGFISYIFLITLAISRSRNRKLML